MENKFQETETRGASHKIKNTLQGQMTPFSGCRLYRNVVLFPTRHQKTRGKYHTMVFPAVNEICHKFWFKVKT